MRTPLVGRLAAGGPRTPSGAAGAVRPAVDSATAAGTPGGPAETNRYDSIDKRNEPTPIPLRHITPNITNAQITTRVDPTRIDDHAPSPPPFTHPDTYSLLALVFSCFFLTLLLLMLFPDPACRRPASGPRCLLPGLP